MVVPTDYSSEYLLQKSSLGREKKRIGSLASHLGILDDEFEDIFAAGKISKVWSCYKKLGLCEQTHRYHYITWIHFDKAFAPLQWAQLLRHQIIRENTCPAWVFRPTCGWVDISSGEDICLDVRYRSSELLVKRLVDRSTSEEVFKKWSIMQKYLGLAYSRVR